MQTCICGQQDSGATRRKHPLLGIGLMLHRVSTRIATGVKANQVQQSIGMKHFFKPEDFISEGGILTKVDSDGKASDNSDAQNDYYALPTK